MTKFKQLTIDKIKRNNTIRHIRKKGISEILFITFALVAVILTIIISFK